MLIRSGLLACAAFCATALCGAPASAAPSRCAEASFRVYFSPDAAVLDDAAREMIEAAERDVAECPYAELHVRVDDASPFAAARGQAILAAADAHAWDKRVVETASRAAPEPGAAPAYAEVVMSPAPLRAGAAPTTRAPGAVS